MRFIPFIFYLAFSICLQAQSNIHFTHPAAADVLKGSFNPADYQSSNSITDPQLITKGIHDELNAANLKSLLEKMSSFHTRNTASDTLSLTEGIGAARDWALSEFQKISDDNEGRLIPSFLQWEEVICGVTSHKNIIGILPGTGPQSDECVLVEAHYDSRCETSCNPDCEAHGMEDNGSGSALVLELARVLSKYSFNRSIIFMLTVGEEQNLAGSTALATWCQNNGIKLQAVFNNDIVGGVICGNTASPPGCPGEGLVDSTNVRIYSLGQDNSPHKQLARWTKLQHEEMLMPIADEFNVIHILTPEDRAGRGGDHIPFPPKGFNALRFTSAYEYGDGNPMQSNYVDRQHSSTDRLGKDNDGDGVFDEYYVDFNYLKRNAQINGTALAMSAVGPIPPTSVSIEEIPGGFKVFIEDPNDYNNYRIAVKDFDGNDWDRIFDTTEKESEITGFTSGFYHVSACTVDENGIESFFSEEEFDNTVTSTKEISNERGIHLMQNRPNPFDDVTQVAVVVERVIDYKQAEIIVTDIEGRRLKAYPINLRPGINSILFEHKSHAYVPGIYAYSLVVDGELIDTKKMIYAF